MLPRAVTRALCVKFILKKSGKSQHKHVYTTAYRTPSRVEMEHKSNYKRDRVRKEEIERVERGESDRKNKNKINKNNRQ